MPLAWKWMFNIGCVWCHVCVMSHACISIAVFLYWMPEQILWWCDVVILCFCQTLWNNEAGETHLHSKVIHRDIFIACQKIYKCNLLILTNTLPAGCYQFSLFGVNHISGNTELFYSFFPPWGDFFYQTSSDVTRFVSNLCQNREHKV